MLQYIRSLNITLTAVTGQHLIFPTQDGTLAECKNALMLVYIKILGIVYRICVTLYTV